MTSKINVLSLFDGMSCGQIALDRLGIPVGNYFASEIDKHAIKVTQHNYPNTIQLGDVTKWQDWDIDWENIDLLTAGFPCQAWSVAGKQKGIEDPRGILAITLFKLFDFIKGKNPDLKFLFENVKMKREYLEYLNNLFGVKPIEINSTLVSAQNRPRMYWTNIPGVDQPKDKGIILSNILESSGEFRFVSPEKSPNRKYKKKYLQWDVKNKGHGSQEQRAYYSTGKQGCLSVSCWNHAKILLGNGTIRKYTLKELERLQTIPEGYVTGVSAPQGAKMLGNGWTVDVICHILKNLKEFSGQCS